MGLRFTRGQFVHIVASVNLDAGTGEILYVNPAGAAMEGSASNEHGVELQVTDAAGQILFSKKPQVLLNSEGNPNSRTGLVNEAVPFTKGMHEVLLMMNGQIQSRFVAGQADLPADASITLNQAQPSSPNRRALTGPPEARQSGMTYTIQARAAGDKVWQTLAVGRSVPDIEVDVNQFPAAKKVQVRVLMTNGFEARFVGEHEVVVGNLDEGR
jgi:hypothetical protein